MENNKKTTKKMTQQEVEQENEMNYIMCVTILGSQIIVDGKVNELVHFVAFTDDYTDINIDFSKIPPPEAQPDIYPFIEKEYRIALFECKGGGIFQ